MGVPSGKAGRVRKFPKGDEIRASPWLSATLPPSAPSGFSPVFRSLCRAIAWLGRMASFLLFLCGEPVREVNGTMRWKTIARDATSIREDLEKLGIAPEFSRPVSERLERFSNELTPDTYDAVLSGVAMAYGIHRKGVEGFKKTARDLDEVQRLMSGFGSELRKLDEALRTLAAYVARMRRQTSSRAVTEHRTLH